MTDTSAMPHQLIVNDRNELIATGVSDVDSFDDKIIIAHTTLGELTVRGEKLHILRLNTDSGDLSLSGTVDSLEYTHSKERNGTVWQRLFR